MGRRIRGILVMAVLLGLAWAALIVGAGGVLETSQEIAVDLGLPLEKTLKVLALGLGLLLLLAFHQPAKKKNGRGGVQGRGKRPSSARSRGLYSKSSRR